MDGNFTTGKDVSDIFGRLIVSYNSDELKILLIGKVYYPQLRCMQNENIKGNSVVIQVSKPKTTCKLRFKNTLPEISQLSPMDIEFGFIDLIYYK